MYLLMPLDILELIYEFLFNLIQWLWGNSLFFHKDFFIIDGFMVHMIVPTVKTRYKNIGYKNKLVWKNIIPGREIFVSDLRINSFPRIFLGIIDLFLYPVS
jgi:ABC-type uncharacterized transport system permease subunit